MIRIIASLFAALSLTATAWSQPVFQTEASHAVIMDFETGEILFSKNAEEPMSPASMSKLMTALMVFEALENGTLSEDDELPVSEDAWRRGGAASGSSTMFLEVNSRARVEDLLRGIIVQSGNDACIVVAEALEGSEEAFADAMTARARELGLESATFRNATGWPDPEHLISAADLARLARHIIVNHPEAYGIYAEEIYTYNGIRQFNRNPLLGVFRGADGLKTGHTSVSGYGLVGSAARDGERRIIVFNGMEDERARADEAERLMRSAFADFNVYTLLEAGDPVGSAELYLGVDDTVPVRVSQSVALGMHRRARDEVSAELIYEGPIAAPVSEGQGIGQLEITLSDGRVERYPVEAAASVDRQGMVGRAFSALAQLIRG
ncbi:MAG: D-alanyl-D-alanine carboxypeptidase family protein [Pseudomonadota bacterium]